MSGVIPQDANGNKAIYNSDGSSNTKLAQGSSDIGQVLSAYLDVTVLASQARTVSGEFILTNPVGKYSEMVAFLDVTAATGTTPTLNVKFQTQDPVSLSWFDITELTFTQKTAVGNEKKEKIGGLGSKLKCVYTIGGTTPSFTFSVAAVLKSK